MEARNSNGVPRRTINGVSPKFKRMAELYRLFAAGFGENDFAEAAMVSLYNHESYGTDLSAKNGFAVGKQYLNVQVTMWREDLRAGLISRKDLYDDERFPAEWLDSVLKDLWKGMTYDDCLKTSKIG